MGELLMLSPRALEGLSLQRSHEAHASLFNEVWSQLYKFKGLHGWWNS